MPPWLLSWFRPPVVGRYPVGAWAHDSVVAGMSSEYMQFFGSGGLGFPGYWIAIRNGSITGVCVKAQDPCTAGSIGIEVYKNLHPHPASPGTFVQITPASPNFAVAYQPAGVYTFAAGDMIELRVSTASSFSPSTKVVASFEVTS